MKNRKASLIGLVLVAIALLTVNCSPKPGADSHSPFGVSVSIALSGPRSFPGKSFQEGALLALDDLKKDPSQTPLAFEWNDNTGDAATAATIAQRQQSSSRASLYCVGYGDELQATMPIIAPLGKPVFAMSFQASLTKDPLIFRNIVSYKGESPVFVEYAKKRKPKTIAIIFMDLPESQEQFRQLVIPGLLQSGWKESDIALFPYSVTETDFRTIVAKVKKSSPDLTIINGYQNHLVPMVQALRDARSIHDGNVIGIFALIDLLTLTDSAVLEGIAVPVPEFMLHPSAKAVDFQNRFRTRFGRPPSFNEFGGYDFALIAENLAKRLPASPTNSQILQTLQSTDIQGISGHIVFDQEGDVSYPIETSIFRSGKLVPIEAH